MFEIRNQRAQIERYRPPPVDRLNASTLHVADERSEANMPDLGR